MGTMEDPQEKKRTKTLIEKYDLVLENLSFEYIAQCNSQKELERILKVLRSGEEGVYPQLTQSCEERLAALFPSSRLLITPQEVLKASEEAEREEIKAYSSEMKQKDELLIMQSEAASKAPSLIPIRQTTTVLQLTEKPSTHRGDGDKNTLPPPTTKSVIPRSYADWEKFDAERELLKMDLEDERKMEKKERKNKMSKNTRRKVGKYPSKEEAVVAVPPKDVMTPSEQEAMAQVEKLKGNECYQAKDYETAVKHYSKSIALHPTVDHYSNRAAANLKLDNFSSVLSDCSEALNLDPWNVKALYRRGTANKNLNRSEDAIHDFQQLMQIDPNNAAAAHSLSTLELEKYTKQKREWESQAGTSSSCNPTSSRRMLIQELD